MRRPRTALLAAAFSALLASATFAQVPVPARGVDARVDYASLARLGPWDDRNYALTREDLDWLAPNEHEQLDPIPAFYRVWLRKRLPELRRSGPAQYPLSALNVFYLDHGGYLVDGRLYRGVRRVADRFEVVLEGGADARAWELAGRDPEVVFGESRVTTPNGAAESAVAINPVDPNRLIAGTNGPGFGQEMHVSSDGGQTWAQVSLPLGDTCCDPTVEWSTDGTKGYAATLGGCTAICNIWFYRTDDGGASWTGLESLTPGDPRRELTNAGFSDKELLHVDRSPVSSRKDHVYLTWHDNNELQFARSTDFGNTFSTPIPVSGPGEAGLASDITTDRAGNVYYAWPSFLAGTGGGAGQILVRRSTDGGVTFQPTVRVAATQASFIFPVPSMDARQVAIVVAADADLSDGPFAGSVYLAWNDTSAPEAFLAEDNHVRIQVAYSRNGGAGWTVVTPHATADILSVDRHHPALAVSPDGTVHLTYYDTSRDPQRLATDLFHSWSADGGVTWTQERLTSVQSPKISDGFEYGDYNSLSAVGAELATIYTDNRDETGGAAESVDVYTIGFPSAVPLFADGFETGDLSAWASVTP